jgi:hypothetical protein
MPNLYELQTTMAEALRGRGTLPRQLPLLPLLVTRGVSAASALDVSRNNFVGTLVNALHTSFPAVSCLVGREFFEAVANAFVRQAPPRSPLLDNYGSDFPAFLRTLSALNALPYIAEVAELEWLVNVALHAHDICATHIDAWDIAGLAALDDAAAGSVRLHPASSFGLLRADHPADLVWSAVLALDDLSEATHDDTTHDRALAAIELQSGPVWLCVSHHSYGVDVQRMPEHAWHFAAALRGGEALATAADGVEGDIGALLAAHLRQGHFTSFSIGV